MQIDIPRGAAESYRLWANDRSGKLLNLTGYTVTVTLKVRETDVEPVYVAVCGLDPTNPSYALVPIEGTATATARILVGYVEVRHPDGALIDGCEFVLNVEEHA